MTAALSQFYDVEDIIKQNELLKQIKQNAERRNTIGAVTMSAITRNRNISIGNFTPMNGNTHVIATDNNLNGLNDHMNLMKLDRPHSEPYDRTLDDNMNLNNQQKQPAVNSSRYKTELCRPFEESGHCKYADKCQFAHGAHELKQLQRHPKYKTELCRTFHSKGFCPYGPRCNFIHNDDVSKLNDKNNHITAQTVQQMPSQQYFQHISPPGLSQSPTPMAQRPTSIHFNSSCSSSYGSSADLSPPSSVGSDSPVFFGEDNHLRNSGYTSLNNVLNIDNSLNMVYNGFSDLTSSDLAPLNIQTLANVDIGLFTQQFCALLNLNNQRQSKNISVFDEWKSWNATQLTTASPSSPDSISGESINSAGSFGSDNNFSSCGSPLDSGNHFRLPVFNHISHD